MRSFASCLMLASLALVATACVSVDPVGAQCATCAAPAYATPTVAYHPVVAQPVVVAQPTVAYRPYTGWYPGKMFDQMRLRRAAVAVPANAYTAAYPPAYAGGYSAGYAPAAYTTNYTAGYTPYVTSYAPLAPANCNRCVQTVARPVLLQAVAPACDTCNFTPDCGCSACSSGVSQASYDVTPGCSTCGVGAANSYPSQVASPSVGPQTPQPNLAPIPDDSQYRSNRPIESSEPAGDLHQSDPGPATDSNTLYNAPRLLDPRDRTAARSEAPQSSSRQPTVDVWNAVYRGQTNAQQSSVSQTSATQLTQAELDAEGWAPVTR